MDIKFLSDGFYEAGLGAALAAAHDIVRGELNIIAPHINCAFAVSIVIEYRGLDTGDIDHIAEHGKLDPDCSMERCERNMRDDKTIKYYRIYTKEITLAINTLALGDHLAHIMDIYVIIYDNSIIYDTSDALIADSIKYISPIGVKNIFEEIGDTETGDGEFVQIGLMSAAALAKWIPQNMDLKEYQEIMRDMCRREYSPHIAFLRILAVVTCAADPRYDIGIIYDES